MSQLVDPSDELRPELAVRRRRSIEALGTEIVDSARTRASSAWSYHDYAAAVDAYSELAARLSRLPPL